MIEIEKQTKEQWDNFWIGVDLEVAYINIVLNKETMEILWFDTFKNSHIWYINNTNKESSLNRHMNMFAVGDNSITYLINMGFNVIFHV